MSTDIARATELEEFYKAKGTAVRPDALDRERGTHGLWTPPKPVSYNPFPLVDPGLEPFGSRILVQFRTPPTVTPGGIQLTDEAVEAEKWNTQVGIVLAVGPLAFKNRGTMEAWPEGSWVKVGDLVRCPKYGGDRWEMDEPPLRAFFALFNDLDLLGRVTVGPERMRAFV